MNDLTKGLVFYLQALALALAGAVFVSDAVAQRQDKVLKGDAQCTRCHDETEEYPVLAIAKTKHGTLADGRTPTCTSCHGVSDLHVNRPPDAKERPKPDRMFGKNATTPIAERNQACLTCHQGGKRIHWQLSAHAGRDVACSSCHGSDGSSRACGYVRAIHCWIATFSVSGLPSTTSTGTLCFGFSLRYSGLICCCLPMFTRSTVNGAPASVRVM